MKKEEMYYSQEELINFKGIAQAKNGKTRLRSYPNKNLIIKNEDLMKFLRIKTIK